MKKELPPILSPHDATALILNISFLPGTTDLLEMLSYFREEAQFKHDHANDLKEKHKYATHIVMYIARESLARSLLEALNTEMTAIKAGKQSTLEIEDDTFGSEKLTTPSVCAWADEMGFGIFGWETPRFWRKRSARTYSTEYLDIIDDVIATFCEEGGEHFESGKLPKNAVVSAWIKDKYDVDSANVLNTIGTIIHPGLTKTTKK